MNIQRCPRHAKDGCRRSVVVDLQGPQQRIDPTELVGLPHLAIPCWAAGFEALAKELIAITCAEPTTADPDREIVDGWATKLGFSRWSI